MKQFDRTIQLEASWKEVLSEEFDKDYMKVLSGFLLKEKQQGKQIYPPGNDIFNAFLYTPLNQVEVVILGQDPYHGPGQAHGLCFSVKPGIALPPSLMNVFSEIKNDLGIEKPNHGCLTSWAKQGVLLLNSVLTVEHGRAGAHQGKGWEQFTDKVIDVLNEKCQQLVFLLWGSHAQKKGAHIDAAKHCVLTSPHPSPLSAHRGFIGNQHFSKANKYLESVGRNPINWQLPSVDDVQLGVNTDNKVENV